MKVTIALPVRNEELVLHQSVRKVLTAARGLPDGMKATVVVADNGSTDRTGKIARELARAENDLKYVCLEQAGKGRGVFAAWEKVPADIYVFMDIDLSTDLAALPELVRAAVDNRGLAAGSRYHAESEVERSVSRRVFSLGYQLMLAAAFGTRVADAPCGFKAITNRVWRKVGPQVKDRRWFFDTELVMRAERAGFAVREVPVVWREQVTDGRKSQVNVPRLCWEYLVSIYRLRRDLK